MPWNVRASKHQLYGRAGLYTPAEGQDMGERANDLSMQGSHRSLATSPRHRPATWTKHLYFKTTSQFYEI